MIKMEVQHRGLATLIVSDDAEVEEWADRQTKQPSVYTQHDHAKHFSIEPWQQWQGVAFDSRHEAQWDLRHRGECALVCALAE
jgi:hypothetical protein